MEAKAFQNIKCNPFNAQKDAWGGEIFYFT